MDKIVKELSKELELKMENYVDQIIKKINDKSARLSK